MTQNNKKSFNDILTKVKKPYVILIILAVLLALNPTISYSQPTNIIPLPPEAERKYQVYWLKTHVGDINASIKKEQNNYHITSKLTSHALARRVLKFWMNTSSTSIYGDYSIIRPDHIKVESRLRKTYRVTNLDFNPENSQLISETVTPPDNRDKRPAVPDILKYHTVDPHTAILIAHQNIHLALKYNYKKFSIPIYDGRRRANLYITVIGKENIKIHNKETPVIHIQLHRDVISGATHTERKRMKEEEPVIDIYLEDNDSLLPVKAIAKAPIGSLVAIIKK